MTDFYLWIIIIVMVLIAFTFLMFELSAVIPCCAREPKDALPYTASWTRMAIPEHDSFTVILPPLPPYFFKNKMNNDEII